MTVDWLYQTSIDSQHQYWCFFYCHFAKHLIGKLRGPLKWLLFFPRITLLFPDIHLFDIRRLGAWFMARLSAMDSDAFNAMIHACPVVRHVRDCRVTLVANDWTCCLRFSLWPLQGYTVASSLQIDPTTDDQVMCCWVVNHNLQHLHYEMLPSFLLEFIPPHQIGHPGSLCIRWVHDQQQCS